MFFHVSQKQWQVGAIVTPGHWGSLLKQIGHGLIVPQQNVVNVAWEAALEVARQAYAPQAVSRMDCVFVFDDVQVAKTFRQAHAPSAGIYEMKPPGAVQPYHVGDYDLFNNVPNPLFSALAQRTKDYWTTPARNLPEFLYSGDLQVTAVVP